MRNDTLSLPALLGDGRTQAHDDVVTVVNSLDLLFFFLFFYQFLLNLREGEVYECTYLPAGGSSLAACTGQN